MHALVDHYTTAGLTDVTLKIYPGARHEVYETNAEDVVGDVVGWIAERVRTGSSSERAPRGVRVAVSATVSGKDLSALCPALQPPTST